MAREDLNALIGAIYDCALAPAGWQAVLQRICRWTDSAAGTLAVVNLETGAEYTKVNVGISPAHDQLYKAHYQCTDLFIHPLLARELGEPAISSDLVSDEQLLGSRIYREWASPQGFRDTLMTMFTRQASHLSFMGLTRRLEQRRYDHTDREQLRTLTPHLQRALAISEVIECRTVERHRFAALLDTLNTATLLVDDGRRILHANAAADALLERQAVLSRHAGLLSIHDVPLAQVLEAHRRAPRQRPLPQTFRIRRPAPAADLSVVVLPLWPGEGDDRTRDGLQYAVFVQDGEHRSPLAAEIWLQLFDLTGSELRVLQGLIEGLDATEIADRYGVARSTIRTQLLSLFRKTGTSRQVDLVKLALGAIPPVHGKRAG